MLDLLLFTVVAAAPPPVSWTPTAEADPWAILLEARADVDEGRYAIALAKHIWFYENATRSDPPLSGVRRSMALAAWLELGNRYPPAREALIERRATALDAVGGKDEQEVADAFQDFAAINRTLDEDNLTARTFAELDAKRPETARYLFPAARRALIAVKQYALYTRYIDPDEDWLRAAKTYQVARRLSESKGPEYVTFVETFFIHDVSTLLALLVVNDRRDDAERIAKKARLEWDEPAFHAAIATALTGTLPEPWP